MAVLNSYQGLMGPQPTTQQQQRVHQLQRNRANAINPNPATSPQQQPQQQRPAMTTPQGYATYYGGNGQTSYAPNQSGGYYQQASNQPYAVKGPGPNAGAIILGDTLKGAQAGTNVMPGYGTAAGAAVGAATGYLDYQQANAQYKALNQAQDEANKVNNARYNAQLSTSDQSRMDQLGALNEQYRQMFNMASMQGTAPQISREQQFTNQQLGQSKNDAINRGLYNSTTLNNTQRGIQDDSQRRQQEIYQNDLQNQLALRQQYTNQLVPIQGNSANQRIGIINNATVQGPNASQYAEYYAMAGGQGPYGNALSQMGNSTGYSNGQTTAGGGNFLSGLGKLFG